MHLPLKKIWIVSAIILIVNLYYLYRLVAIFFLSLFTVKYEKKETLNQYILIQYGSFLVNNRFCHSDNFYRLVFTESIPYMQNHMKVLDVGCALGRLVFEFEKNGIYDCYGIDSSKRFINFCRKIQNGKITLEKFKLHKSNAKFILGDIFFMDFQNKTFDFISCINVLDRVRNPNLLIDKLRALLANNGVLVLSTPYDWENSPAPSKHYITDIGVLLKKIGMKIEKDIKDIPYTIPLNDGYRTYHCHLVIARKIND